MSAVIKQILSDPEDLNKVAKNVFDAVDIDKSGFIEANEFSEILINICNEFGFTLPSEEDCNAILKELDEDGSKKIEFNEFQMFIAFLLESINSSE